MAPTPGTRIGVYDITVQIGEGGMGQVYRARDTKLNRDVALKVLPDAVANDGDRLARFTREAQTLASLNHPNIAHIHGIEESGGVRALVMELVEGEDLSQRLARGPIDVDDALPIARQIAEALEAAHERGVIHRDLKPANIKLRPDGTVKVLDFGLAKALAPIGASGADAPASPTITTPAMTQMGLILGTAAYMSPEQAKGQPADKRSDIWSFGAVLHEMLSGRRTFNGDDTVDTLAAVRHQDVDWTALPPRTPTAVRSLLARCLERDVRQRLRDIGEARILLQRPADLLTPVPENSRPAERALPLWRRAVPLVVTAILFGAIAAITAWQLKPSSTLPVMRFPFTLPEGQTYVAMGAYGRPLAMSPDGAQMIYAASPGQLYLRSMTQFDARPIPGTELYEGVGEPAFSPDGRSVAFFARGDQTLKRIAVTGGTAVTICSLAGPATPRGMTWDADGIVFGLTSAGVMRVSSDGGTPEVIARIGEGEEVYGAMLLPDRQHVLFTIATGTARDRWDRARIVVQSLTSGERKTLIEGGSDARYVPTGHLVYALSGIVYAVAFDLQRLAVYGPRVPVIQGIRRSASGLNGAAAFSVSSTGVLTYMPGPLSATQNQLALADRKGGVELLKIAPGNYSTPRVSPDGQRIAFVSEDGKEAVVYIYDLDGGPVRRLTYGGNNRAPIWSRDGKRVVFQSDREGDMGIWWQATAGGAAERLTKAEPTTAQVPESWSPIGDMFLYSVTKGAEVSLRTYSLTDKKDVPFGGVRSSNPTNAVFSPDGRWVAYASTEGFPRTTVFVQPFPATGDRFQLLPKGGDGSHEVVWTLDGKELLYNAGPNGRFESVSVTTTPVFAFGNPAAITRRFINPAPAARRAYDITPSGRFVGLLQAGTAEAGAAAGPQILFVLNWYEELKRLAPTK